MISFNKIRDLLKKETDEAETSGPDESDNATIPPPVQVAPASPAPRSATRAHEPRSAFDIKPPGDTQELDDDMIAEQLDGLKRTMESGSFERTEATAAKEQVPFGNSPPTIEMERPDLKD